MPELLLEELIALWSLCARSRIGASDASRSDASRADSCRADACRADASRADACRADAPCADASCADASHLDASRLDASCVNAFSSSSLVVSSTMVVSSSVLDFDVRSECAARLARGSRLLRREERPRNGLVLRESTEASSTCGGGRGGLGRRINGRAFDEADATSARA